MQKNIKIRRINQIFNKVGSSNGKNKRDVVLKKIDQDITKLELFTKTEDCVPILLNIYCTFFYCLTSQMNVLQHEILTNLIKNRQILEYMAHMQFTLCMPHRIDLLCTII